MLRKAVPFGVAYDKVVRPRVEALHEAHPRVRTCSELLHLIDSHLSEAEFLRLQLDTKAEARAKTLRGVLTYLDRVQSGFPGATEEKRLAVWAQSVAPRDYLAVGVRGFGLAGFQYLRLLLGADAIKPDVYIVEYVARIVNRKVSPLHALEVLTQAATTVGVSATALDGAIWEAGARTSKEERCGVPPSSP